VSTPAADKSIGLASVLDPDVPVTVSGDRARLRQVLINLLENAVKFTATGEVTLRVSLEPRDAGSPRVRFSVQDTGIGIAEADASKLFQPFVQLDFASNRRHGGTGLGLNLSQRLVTLMGGTIELTSEPGVGSTFFFALPLASGSSPEAATPAPEPELQGAGTHAPEFAATDRLATIRPQYIESRKCDLTRLMAAVESGDLDTVRKLGQRMRGTGSSYGCEPISEIGGSLETAARAEDLSLARASLDELAHYLERAGATLA